MTFHLVTTFDETTTSDPGDPGTLGHNPITTHFEYQEDVTDQFTGLSGRDQDDVTYGEVEVELTGQAASSGTLFERHVISEDVHNALGCHYLDERRSEVSGSWTRAAPAAGNIRFSDDGTYRITVGANISDPVTGESAEYPWLPEPISLENIILEGAPRDCPPAGIRELAGDHPPGNWAHGLGYGNYIDGSLDPANPGSVVDGSLTFYLTDVFPTTITVTWHLVHEGPINLPHS